MLKMSSISRPVYAEYAACNFVSASGVAIFHIKSGRVVLCYHTRDKYWFLPKGRRDAGESSTRAAEREGFEEVCTLISTKECHADSTLPVWVPRSPNRTSNPTSSTTSRSWGQSPKCNRACLDHSVAKFAENTIHAALVHLRDSATRRRNSHRTATSFTRISRTTALSC